MGRYPTRYRKAEAQGTAEEAERSIRASIGWNPWRHCAAWRKGSERQFRSGLPLRDCHQNCPLWPTTTALWRQYSIVGFQNPDSKEHHNFGRPHPT
jgi:hypothetical protein